MVLYATDYVENEIVRLAEEVSKMDRKPTLALIRIGDDYASKVYVNNKIKMCERIGIKSKVYELSEHIVEQSLLDFIKYDINDRHEIDGCLIQLPLPKHLNENKILEVLNPMKDVDGFTKENLGKLVRGENTIVACTPKGIIDLLKFYNIPMAGKNVVIINRSTIVGKPLTMLFLEEDATVTICHSKTNKQTMLEHIRKADIVVTAIGKPKFFKSIDFTPFTTIVDVSMNRDEDGKLCGDVDKDSYDTLVQKCCNIVPVPKGVGQTTVLSLMKNVIEAKKRKEFKEGR